MDGYELSRLVYESLLSDEVRERIRVRYDHEDKFLDFPSGVLLMMTFDICNASVSFDIEGAHNKLEALTLSNYP
jgi:hypothetical protein